MKYILLSSLVVGSFFVASNAETNMFVELNNGKTIVYKVDSVKQVYFGENADGVSISGKICGYNYVDLGLASGTKWATFNVGASKPTGYGDYFAWGETATKDSFSFKNYKWEDPNYYNHFSKYVMNVSYGQVDSLMVLDHDDDAASVIWGCDWRMPTHEEQIELVNGCDWTWTDDFNGSGVAGSLGTSKVNGNVIFFPAAGSINSLTFVEKIFCGTAGSYWSSSLDKESTCNASSLSFRADCVSYNTTAYRENGFSVRAVVK